ncbi:hypothetical protein quinque_009986 [Culex quinquefasciatus]
MDFKEIILLLRRDTDDGFDLNIVYAEDQTNQMGSVLQQDDEKDSPRVCVCGVKRCRSTDIVASLMFYYEFM